MEAQRSPLFPPAVLTSASGPASEGGILLPTLPEQPLFLTSSIQVYIVPAEKRLFVQGFKPVEFEGLPPTLLRGSLVVRVLKPTKIKSITLKFRGVQKTDWPEGIPPKRNVYLEQNDLVSHLWPFYQMETHLPNCGADLVAPKNACGRDELDAVSLEPLISAFSALEAPTLFAASLIKRATSPLVGGASPTRLAPLEPVPELTTVLSSLSLATMDFLKPGNFEPGDYVYNFEHPIPALSPESMLVSFGSVCYALEATIVRTTKFKSTLTGRIPVNVVRIPSDNSVEENQPIVIERDWEDQMRYEIVVASKAVVLDSYLPLAFRFIPLYGKVSLHRIRVYITENCSYYCRNKSVHRAEPTRKFLLLEHKAKKNCSLLAENEGELGEDAEVLPRELEFQMYVPSVVNKKFEYRIHPDTAVENIQCDHWIKISLRISRPDPKVPDKRKHFEILIDSPIHLCSPLAAHNNTLLPAYDKEPEFLPRYAASPVHSPGVTAIDESQHRVKHNIMSALGAFSPSPTVGGSNPEILSSATPVEFQHVTGEQNNDTPSQRDGRMHLESNLYEPEDPKIIDALASPQATAYTPIASPTVGPVTVPVPQPSSEPPSFDTVGMANNSLPPAYERIAPIGSLSPLRIDVASESEVVSQYNCGSNSLGIKDALGRQLDRRGRFTMSDGESMSSDASSKKREILDPRKSTEDNSSKAESKQLVPELAPEHVPDLTPECAPAPDGSELTTAPSTDIVDIEDPQHLRVEAPFSPRSSVSLMVSLEHETDDFPIDQTLPLLSLSNTSETDIRLLIDSGRGVNFFGTTSVTDLLEASGFGEGHHINGSLFQLRNPRIKKHYQESAPEIPSKVLHFDKPRQKSFGVQLVPESHGRSARSLTGSSAESNYTINELSESAKDGPQRDPLTLQYVVSK